MRHPQPTTSSCSPLLAALLGLASLAGCDPVDDGEGLEPVDAAGDDDALDDGEDGELEPADELAAEPDAAAQQLMWSYSWQQGQPEVAMGSFADRFCFLTEVAGHFGSGYERARVYEWNGSWWLGGMGFQEGIRASALCIPRDYWGLELEVSGEYTWREGAPFVDMGPATGRVCMLTHVQGDLDGEGDGVEAYPTLGPEGGRWWLGGMSQDGDGGVMGAARCVDIDPEWRQGPYEWVKNPYYLGSFPTPMVHTNYYACGLTQVRGDFNNYNERVGAYVDQNDQWYLHGGTWTTNTAYGDGVWATAYCF